MPSHPTQDLPLPPHTPQTSNTLPLLATLSHPRHALVPPQTPQASSVLPCLEQASFGSSVGGGVFFTGAMGDSTFCPLDQLDDAGTEAIVADKLRGLTALRAAERPRKSHENTEDTTS